MKNCAISDWCSTDSDRENRTIICLFTPTTRTNKLTTRNIPLINLKDISDYTYRIIDQMTFLVESESDDCKNAILSYRFVKGYHLTGTCSETSSNQNQCSCLQLSSFNGRCTFFIDCSSLMRNNSISKVWNEQSPNFIRLKMQLSGGIIKFAKYYQRNFKCKRVDDHYSICNLLSSTRSNVNCYRNGSITLHGCYCSSMVALDDHQSILSDKSSNNSWTSSPSPFIRKIYQHLATAEELGHLKYNFYILPDNLGSKIYNHDGSDIFGLKEFADSNIKFFINNACPSNPNDGFPLVNLLISLYNYPD